MIALITGLVSQVNFPTVLSLVYRAPLDIKSLHKIPRDVSFSRTVFFHPYGLAPLSWEVIYAFGLPASVYLSENAFCEWQGGPGLVLYLPISSNIRFYGGSLIIVFSLVSSFFSLAPIVYKINSDACRNNAGQAIAMNAIYTFLDFAWCIQGVVW